jgi:hypothetical protein
MMKKHTHSKLALDLDFQLIVMLCKVLTLVDVVVVAAVVAVAAAHALLMMLLLSYTLE